MAAGASSRACHRSSAGLARALHNGFAGPNLGHPVQRRMRRARKPAARTVLLSGRSLPRMVVSHLRETCMKPKSFVPPAEFLRAPSNAIERPAPENLRYRQGFCRRGRRRSQLREGKTFVVSPPSPLSHSQQRGPAFSEGYAHSTVAWVAPKRTDCSAHPTCYLRYLRQVRMRWAQGSDQTRVVGDLSEREKSPAEAVSACLSVRDSSPQAWSRFSAKRGEPVTLHVTTQLYPTG